MKIGAIFPTTEIGNDPVAIRDWAQTAESLGYSHMITYDHVLGAIHADREPALARDRRASQGHPPLPRGARRRIRAPGQRLSRGPLDRGLVIEIALCMQSEAGQSLILHHAPL